MKHLNNRNNSIVTTVKVLSLATTIILIIGIVVITTAPPLTALVGDKETAMLQRGLAPAVVSGDNIYIAWWTNNTANNNQEVMFRASNDGGATFGDKMNLSNTPDADSTRVEIAGEGANV